MQARILVSRLYPKQQQLLKITSFATLVARAGDFNRVKEYIDNGQAQSPCVFSRGIFRLE